MFCSKVPTTEEKAAAKNKKANKRCRRFATKLKKYERQNYERIRRNKYES